MGIYFVLSVSRQGVVGVSKETTRAVRNERASGEDDEDTKEKYERRDR